jgi:hypothetical protein
MTLKNVGLILQFVNQRRGASAIGVNAAAHERNVTAHRPDDTEFELNMLFPVSHKTPPVHPEKSSTAIEKSFAYHLGVGVCIKTMPENTVYDRYVMHRLSARAGDIARLLQVTPCTTLVLDLRNAQAYYRRTENSK